MKKRWSLAAIPQSSASGANSALMAGAATSSPVAPVSRANARLEGKVMKKNSGFLRQWRSRQMVVTADGFLRYEKKKGDSVRVKETDLLKAEISPTLSLQGMYYCIEVHCGANQFSLGFSSKSEARLWQEVMMEVADANAAGRRVWVAQLRHVLTLTLRDRRDAVEAMGHRDWISEWNFCWKSLKDRKDDDFNGRRRRLKRLYTIWLQFHLFAEIVAEIHYATVQSRDTNRSVSSSSHDHSQMRKTESDNSDSRSDSRSDKSSVLSSTGWSASWSGSPVDDDVDVVKMKTIKLEYGSKTWGGEKRLKKEMADLARFRRTLEQLTSAHGMHAAMSKFPVFPLLAAFSIRGIPVVASALPRSDEIDVMQIDRRDLAELTGGLRVHGDLSRFAFSEFPDVWVRCVRGAHEKGEIVRVSSKYDDVLRYSLRSSMVHGVLLRAGNDTIEVLSAHDISELVQGISPRWTPYLNLLYYQLETTEDPINNHPARQFLLKRPKSLSCHGDIVIAVEPNRSRLQLNLKQAFVQKYQIELVPVLRRLQEVKMTTVQLVAGSHALKTTESPLSDPAAAIIDELELTIKRLLRRHVRDIADKLVTMGDEIGSAFTNDARGTRAASASVSMAYNPDARARQSSFDSLPSGARRGFTARRIYLIDVIHLRRTLKSQGVNTSLFPLVFAYVNSLRQPGVQILLAADIVGRIAKTLFQFRLSHDQNADKSRWRSRKSRLIEFMTQIMSGLQAEEGASQFWDVDAPIWFMLGPYAASIALGEYGFVQPSSTMEIYRELLRENPAVLFNCLLQNFGAHLADGYLPTRDETRWKSLPFLRREGQLTFFDEAIDPKLAIVFHAEWLSATTQSYRLYFEDLQRLFVDRGGAITAKSEIQSAKVFFEALASQFRHAVVSASETRIENAIAAMEIQDAACETVVKAHVALQEYRLDSARGLVNEACDAIVARGAQLSFPLELKLYLLAVAAMSDRASGPLSPTKQGTSALTTRWSLTLSWLQHFYRTAHSASILPSICPHPLAEAIRLMVGASRTSSESLSSPRLASLRTNLERGAGFEMWEALAPVVERQFHLAGTPSVTASGAGPSQKSILTRTSSSVLDSESLAAADAMRRSSSDPIRAIKNATTGAMDLAASSAGSSWDRVLRTLEQLLLPAIRATSSAWMIPGYLFDVTMTQNARFPPAVMSETISVPGLAFLWGQSNGLSLDEESKLSSTPIDGISCRPHSVHDIRVLELPLPTRRVLQVACGYRHTALITAEDQCLYTFGYGECGRLGHGDEQSVELPKRVDFFSEMARNQGGPQIAGARQVACGREHTMVVLLNGELYGFGWAEAGRLGTGESGSVVTPSRVAALTEIEAVACGREHTLALTKAGTVFAFGAGFGGRLGNGGENDEELPVQVTGLQNEHVVQVDAGECHSCVLTKDGDVFSWGFGSSGALGTGSRDNALSPVKVNGPWVESREGERAVGVACGSYHSLAYTTHGRVYGWGDSAAGQLGDKLVDAEDMVVLTPQQLKLPRSTIFQGDANSLQRISAIACGTFTSAASTTDGKLFVWGSAAAGNGQTLDREDAKLKSVSVVSEFPIDKIACGAYHCVALSASPQWT